MRPGAFTQMRPSPGGPPQGAKRVLRKYNGIPRDSFRLFLRECEFRFNYGTHEQQFNTLKK